jgi:hypothetical protein
MDQEMNLKDAAGKIRELRRTTEELRAMSLEFPAVFRNTARILASIKMLELNISDIAAVQAEENL